MAKGGKRTDSGRKPNSKDSKPRKRKSKVPAVIKKSKNELANPDDATLFSDINSFLGAKNRKKYKGLLKKYESPLDCLIAVRDDLMVRFKTGRIQEIEASSRLKEEAKVNLKEIKEDSTLFGAALTPAKKRKYLAQYQKVLDDDSSMMLSSITTLATELRQINELIDRLESGNPSNVFNIFNLLDGKLDREKTVKLRNKIFTLPENMRTAEDIARDKSIEDAEIIKENEKEGE